MFSLGLPKYIPRSELPSPSPKNVWTDVDASEFLVRGPNYLKQPGKNVLSLKQPKHSANVIGETRRYLQEQGGNIDEDDPEGLPLFLIICFGFSSLWGGEYTLVQQLFKRNGPPKCEDSGVAASAARFMTNDDVGKNEQLKYMFRLIEAPSATMGAVSALGGERPVIIGKRLTTKYFQGKNYLEIFLDVGSSVVASMLNSTMLKSASTAIVDMCYLFEAQKEGELPERVLATCRWNFFEPDNLYTLLDSNGEVINKKKM